MFVSVFDQSTRAESTKLAAELRAQGINVELQLEERKLGRQFQFADRKHIPLVAVLGPEEIAQGAVKIKRLSDGEEFTVQRNEVTTKVRELLGAKA